MDEGENATKGEIREAVGDKNKGREKEEKKGREGRQEGIKRGK